MTARHRPEILRRRDRVGRVYQLVCTCGQAWDEHVARRLAEVDMSEHLLSLPPVPAAQQCRDPRRHDRRDWEPCQVCAAQVTLFDLAEVTR
ncbi:hypothetical protein GCM10010466_65500 [Planomonospora alba]|uniref:Uncharacterized protein n=1 Tax=Planomonospora alba TaxID=161354 RepID=A0ABP6P5B6_9ACTN